MLGRPKPNLALPMPALFAASQRALKGTRILSLCLNLPGPAALARLRELGARCLKIEPPAAPDGAGGDPMRHYSEGFYRALHRGIRIEQANLKEAKGQRRLQQLLSRTDVLITSFRPQALKALGLNWPVVHRDHPQLSMISVVGSAGKQAQKPGHDLTYLAANQLIDSLEMPATLYADMGAALLIVQATLQAVLAHERTGKSSFAQVAIADAAVHLAQPRNWGLTGPGTILGGAHAAYRLYPCADGRVAVAALEPHFAQTLCALVGLNWQGPTMWLQAPVHARIAAFMAARTCADLQALAKAHDLPLQTLHQTDARPDSNPGLL